jgi:CDGSH-type Zn-finger protein
MTGITGVADNARVLAARTDELRAQCEALAGVEQDERTRATLARVAGRLASSVVRPLHDALGRGHDPEDSETTADADPAHVLHLLAVEATRLRVRARGAPSLQEAAAALQDLSCQAIADDIERLEARRTEFAALLKGLPRTIQSAPNGPYLVTNVDTVTDWLGVRLDPTPQAALCRCGASAIKPWCDGSHAQIGFEDAKSDRRVPDRLDRYQGLGVSPITAGAARTPVSAPIGLRPCSGPTRSHSSRPQAAASMRSCAPLATAHPAR